MPSAENCLRIRNSGKMSPAPEKSNFAQTCNLLSQYIKEKGSLRDLSFEIAGKLETKGKPELSTFASPNMNLLPKTGEPTQPLKPLDLFPQSFDVNASYMEDATNNVNFSKSAEVEPETAQMTIFYGGQVLVFDDFRADKAKELMLFASNGSFPSGSKQTQELLQSQPPKVSNPDLPIMRTGSLYRFLEKRKDRIRARAPYQLQRHSSPNPTPSTKQEEQLELKL